MSNIQERAHLDNAQAADTKLSKEDLWHSPNGEGFLWMIIMFFFGRRWFV